MGLLDKIKNVFSGTTSSPDEADFEKVISDTWKECAEKNTYFWNLKLNETNPWTTEVKNWPEKKKVNFVLYLVKGIHNFSAGRTTWRSDDIHDQKNSIRQAYVQTLFRNKLIMDDEDVRLLYNAFALNKTGDWAVFTTWPIGLLLNQLEKQRKDKDITTALKEVLEQIKESINAVKASYQEKDRIKMINKIDAMLFKSENESGIIKPAKFLGEDPFAEFANDIISNMPEGEKKLWYQLLPMMQKASGSKPSNKYIADTKNIIKELGNDKYKKIIHEWLQFLVNLKERQEQNSISYDNGYTYNYTSYDYITAVNADAVKGLIWTCSQFHDAVTIQTIASLAERAFKKIPGKGPTSASIGNACLYVLYKSKGLDGIGQLSRLKMRIKQNSTQNMIEKYLQDAAKEQGVTVHEIEDMAVDDGGLTNGSRVFQFDEYKAELLVTGVGRTETKWYKPDGALQKSVPAIIKEKYAARYKKLKDVTKQIEQTLVAQRDRIDRMLRSDRRISKENFELYYLQHGLLSYLANNIIWNFHSSDKIVTAIHLNNQWVNAANEIVAIDSAESVSLWHPVHASVAEIKAWREFFVFHQLQQPLKQAYREMYLLTDAEVNTKSYSNRMAAHLLRQHQFNSLAKARGWRYVLMGAFDNGVDNGTASLLLPEYNLRAEYWISEVNADGATNDTGIWNYVSTDQVRFIDNTTNNVLDLVDIPPVVFSEVMRDVDLFVGVASVGNDPAWQDSGGLPAYRDYWTTYSFGELSEVAKNRKEILTSLVPRLKIKDVATIKDKFLVVKGKLRTYKIHIGSTNILMEPNDQYLCIVPDRSAKNHTENLFLPFEGDNGLSIILSKAFLLADDVSITDSTITSQINRK
jgi:Domain of unknown function (DUF4132)